MDVLIADLERTLSAGVRQLLGFKRALLAGVPGLERLSVVRHVELLVVTFDEVPFGNWVMRDAIAKRVGSQRRPDLLNRRVRGLAALLLG
jgi:hypothetical protein